MPLCKPLFDLSLFSNSYLRKRISQSSWLDYSSTTLITMAQQGECKKVEATWKQEGSCSQVQLVPLFLLFTKTTRAILLQSCHDPKVKGFRTQVLFAALAGLTEDGRCETMIIAYLAGGRVTRLYTKARPRWNQTHPGLSGW